MTTQEKKKLHQRWKKQFPEEGSYSKIDSNGNPILDGVRGKLISELISELESLKERYGDMPIYGYSGNFFPIKIEVEEAVPPERWCRNGAAAYEIIDAGWIYDGFIC